MSLFSWIWRKAASSDVSTFCEVVPILSVVSVEAVLSKYDVVEGVLGIEGSVEAVLGTSGKVESILGVEGSVEGTIECPTRP